MLVPWSFCNSTCLCMWEFCTCETGFCFRAQAFTAWLESDSSCREPRLFLYISSWNRCWLLLEGSHMCYVCVCEFECVHVRWPLTVQKLLCWPGSLDTKAVILAKTSTHTPHPSHICYSNSCQLRWTYTPYFLYSPFPFFSLGLLWNMEKKTMSAIPAPFALPFLFLDHTQRFNHQLYFFFFIFLSFLCLRHYLSTTMQCCNTPTKTICASSLKSSVKMLIQYQSSP